MTVFGTINAWAKVFHLQPSALYTLLTGVPRLKGKNKTSAGWSVSLFTRSQVERAISGQLSEPALEPPSQLLITDHWGYCVVYG